MNTATYVYMDISVYLYTHQNIHLCVRVCVFVCVFMCVCEREREREREIERGSIARIIGIAIHDAASSE